VAAAASLPALPAGWPADQFELGLADGAGGGATLHARAPFAFRYQYLAGGVNTGLGWATWNTNGQFVSWYVADSAANHAIPVFPYYMLLQSTPATGTSESARDLSNLANHTTMAAYYADLRLFFARAAGSPGPHVEPDLWPHRAGRLERHDGATSGEAWRRRAGGPTDTAAGFAQPSCGSETLAPNVILAITLRLGHGLTCILAALTPRRHFAARRAFYNSLGAGFDVAFADIADRDAAFKQLVYGDGGASWWNATDFPRYARFYAGFTAATGKRTVIWQIPLGNSKMRALNNTWGHYQDNRAEWFLDDPTGPIWRCSRQRSSSRSCSVAASGTTCACEAIGDGITILPPSTNTDLAHGRRRWRLLPLARRDVILRRPVTLDGTARTDPTPAASPTPTPARRQHRPRRRHPPRQRHPRRRRSPPRQDSPTPTITWTERGGRQRRSRRARASRSRRRSGPAPPAPWPTSALRIEGHAGEAVSGTPDLCCRRHANVQRGVDPRPARRQWTVKVGVLAPGWGPMLPGTAPPGSVTKR
jgi:hypothetical protein